MNARVRRILSNGGQVGQVISGKDWSTADIGPTATWSETFEDALNACLSTRLPCMLAWGKRLEFFYNDSAVDLLGPKHPSALGQPAAQVWAEVWDTLAEIYEHVMRIGTSYFLKQQLFFIRRSVEHQEVYVDVSYAPNFCPEGTVMGVSLVVHERTESVIGQRQNALLQRCAEKVARAGGEHEAYHACLATLKDASADLPSASIYLLSPDGCGAMLFAHDGRMNFPASLDLSQPKANSPFLTAFERVANRGGIEYLKVGRKMLDLQPVMRTAAPEVIAMIPLRGRGETKRPSAVLVCAVSPLQPLNQLYQRFFALLMEVVTHAVATANALAQERTLAEMRVDVLSEQKAGLARLLQARSDFVSVASHELKTPLTSLSLLTQGMQRKMRKGGATDPSLLLDTFDSMDSQLQRLCRLVDDMMDLRRVDGGTLSIEPENCELVSLVRDVVNRLAAQLAPTTIALQSERSHFFGNWDRVRIEQVVTNLLTNGARYGEGKRLSLALRCDGQWVNLTVADQGPGVAAKDRERIFSRFERAASKKELSGLGLGLFITRQIVEMHGGTVHVEEKASGRGAVFVVRLPMVTAQLSSSVNL